MSRSITFERVVSDGDDVEIYPNNLSSFELAKLLYLEITLTLVVLTIIVDNNILKVTITKMLTVFRNYTDKIA